MLPEGAQVRPFPLPFPKNAFYLLVSTNLLCLSRYGVTCVAFKPDNPNIVVSGSYDETIKTWDITSGSCLSTLNVGSGVNSVHFNKSGDTVAAGCDDGTVQIIDVATAEVKRPLNVGYAFSRFSTRISVRARPLFSRFSTRISV